MTETSATDDSHDVELLMGIRIIMHRPKQERKEEEKPD